PEERLRLRVALEQDVVEPTRHVVVSLDDQIEARAQQVRVQSHPPLPSSSPQGDAGRGSRRGASRACTTTEQLAGKSGDRARGASAPGATIVAPPAKSSGRGVRGRVVAPPGPAGTSQKRREKVAARPRRGVHRSPLRGSQSTSSSRAGPS